MNEIDLLEYIKVELLGNEEHLDLSAKEDLLESGLLDSLSIMRLIGHIETVCKFNIPPQDMIIENFMTVQTICNYIDRR